MRLSRTAMLATVASLAFAGAVATPTLAQMKEQAVTVGGAPMYPSKNIIQNAVTSTGTQHGWRISNADRV